MTVLRRASRVDFDDPLTQLERNPGQDLIEKLTQRRIRHRLVQTTLCCLIIGGNPALLVSLEPIAPNQVLQLQVLTEDDITVTEQLVGQLELPVLSRTRHLRL